MSEYLEVWDTADKLRSSEFRAILYPLALQIKFDTCDLECLMASLRRRNKARLQTHQQDIEQLSADFVLQRCRLWSPVEPCSGRPGWTEQRIRRRRSGKLAGKRSGGGGARGAPIGNALSQAWASQPVGANGKKQPLSNQQIADAYASAHRKARSASAAERAAWKSMGRAGTLSHSMGQASFGRKRKAWVPQPRSVCRRLRGHMESHSSAGASGKMQAECIVQACAREIEACQREKAEEGVQAQLAAQAVQAWSARHLVSDSFATPGHDRHHGGQLVPAMQAAGGDASMDVVEFVPPVHALAQSAMSSNPRTPHRKRLHKELSAAWSKQHERDVHGDLPKLPYARDKISSCMAAGFCLHTLHGQAVARVVRNIEKGLCNSSSSLLKKGNPGRALYDAAVALIRIHPPGSAPCDLDFWLHLGYGNLSTSQFTVFSMTVVEGRVGLEESVLDSPRPLNPSTLWSALWEFDPTSDWDMCKTDRPRDSQRFGRAGNGGLWCVLVGVSDM